MYRTLCSILVMAGVASWGLAQTDWEKTRSIAEAQHGIVMLSIKNKQFDKVLPASKKIMALNFPAEREPLLVDHVRLTSAALVEAGQLPLAHLVLDEALKVVRTNKSKVTFYKEKALVCTKEGRDDLAVKWLEQAVKLEESKE